MRGPFDGVRQGLIDTPVRIFDLSAGGCFVNSTHEQAKGVRCTFRIDVGDEDAIEVQCETVYVRPGFGYAVRFVDIDHRVRERIRRAVLSILDRTE